MAEIKFTGKESTVFIEAKRWIALAGGQTHYVIRPVRENHRQGDLLNIGVSTNEKGRDLIEKGNTAGEGGLLVCVTFVHGPLIQGGKGCNIVSVQEVGEAELNAPERAPENNDSPLNIVN